MKNFTHLSCTLCSNNSRLFRFWTTLHLRRLLSDCWATQERWTGCCVEECLPERKNFKGFNYAFKM